MLLPLCNMTGSSGSPLNLTTLEQSAKKTEVRRERNVLTKLFESQSSLMQQVEIVILTLEQSALYSL